MNLLALYVVPSFYFYWKLNKIFQTCQEKKIAANTTSLFHASSTIIISYSSLYFNTNSYFIVINSSGYLLYDTYYILKTMKFDILNIMYLYHHSVVFLYILLPCEEHFWREVLLIAELSNIPNYLVYYSLKNDRKLEINRSKTTYILLKIQLLVYFILRIIFIGYFSLKELYNDEVNHVKTLYMVSIVYLFGIMWFIAMLKQNI